MKFGKLKILFAGITSLALLLGACSTPSDNPQLSSFDGGTVHYDEYVSHFLKSTQYKPNVSPTIDNLIKIVELKSIEKMASQEALFEKIDEDSLYNFMKENNERRMLYQKYVSSGYTNKIITDSLIQAFYSKYTPQYNMKFIMRPLLKESTQDFVKVQRNSINAAYKELLSGVEFGKVAEKYSQDKTTNQKGGDLGWIIVESMGDHVVRSVMDTLSENSYSAPFRGFGGYYILYKGAHREVEVPPFKSIKQRIWKSLYHSRKGYIQDALDKKFDKLAKEFNFKKNQNTINKILKKCGFGSNVSKYRELNFSKLTPSDKALKICEYDGGAILLGELFVNSKKSPINKFEFTNRLNNISELHLFSLDARKLNLQDKDELPEQLESMRTSLLRALLFKKKVGDKVDAKLIELKMGKSPGERKKIQDEFRLEYENYLKTKYKFSFNNENFDAAIELAKERKEIQNRERKSKAINNK